MVHTAQPLCMHVPYVFMHYELCEMHIYSLYVLIYSYSTLPSGLWIPRKVALTRKRMPLLAGWEGTFVTSEFMVEPDFKMVDATGVVASSDPDTPSVSGVAPSGARSAV